MKDDPIFTLYWYSGKREIVQGRTIAEAMTLAGYSGGALRALDFYASGDDHNWEWNKTNRDWKIVGQWKGYDI
jgi:hypothetical protein